MILWRPSFDHLTAVSSVVSSPTQGTCESNQVLLVGVPGSSSWGALTFAPSTGWPASYEMKLF